MSTILSFISDTSVAKITFEMFIKKKGHFKSDKSCIQFKLSKI